MTQPKRFPNRGKNTVYVAGPMRGYKDFNFHAFDKAAFYLRESGWTVFSPAEHDRESGFDETQNSLDGFSLEDAFRWDIATLLHVDAIALLPAWEDSAGVAVELAVARILNLRILEFSCLLTGTYADAPNAIPVYK
jgi:hypothetical protein